MQAIEEAWPRGYQPFRSWADAQEVLKPSPSVRQQPGPKGVLDVLIHPETRRRWRRSTVPAEARTIRSLQARLERLTDQPAEIFRHPLPSRALPQAERTMLCLPFLISSSGDFADSNQLASLAPRRAKCHQIICIDNPAHRKCRQWRIGTSSAFLENDRELVPASYSPFGGQAARRYPSKLHFDYFRQTDREGDHSTLVPANTTKADIADEAERLLQGMNFQPAMG
jgi:hypothetical protein